MSALNVFKALVVFATSALIARSIPPSEFGLISFALPFMAFLVLITDLGIAAAIVRQQDLSPNQAGGALKVLLLLGSFAAAFMALLARPAELWFALPGLSSVMIGFAVVAGLSIYAVVPRALLERKLHYSRVAKIEFLSILVGIGMFGVALRWKGGIEAILAFHIGLQITRSVWFFHEAKSDYELTGAIRGAAGVISYGAWNLVSNLLSFAARNIDRFIIARTLGAAALGVYGLAYQFMTVPLMIFAWPASGVLLAALSRSEGRPEVQRSLLLAISGATSYLVFSIAAALIMFGGYPLDAFYGARWDGLRFAVCVLAPIGAIQSLAVYAGSYFVASGRVKVNVIFSVLHTINTAVAFGAFSRLDLAVCIIAYSVGSSIISVAMIFVMCRNSSTALPEYIRAVLPGLFVMLVAGLSTGLEEILPISAYLAWVAKSIAFLIVFLLVGYACRRTFTGYVNILKGIKIAGVPNGS